MGECIMVGSGRTVDWISGKRKGWVGKICGGGDMAGDSAEEVIGWAVVVRVYRVFEVF